VVSKLVYYAMGGGLGHLVRARAFLHTRALEARATVVTASSFAYDVRVTAGLDVLVAPNDLERTPAVFKQWLTGAVRRLDANCLCVDTFPAGILGELNQFELPGVQLWHVARALRWQSYEPLLPATPPRFDRCWRVEALADDHETYLAAHCNQLSNLELRDPPLPAAPSSLPPPHHPYWLVVHSGPPAEVAELIAYAAEIRAFERADVPLCVLTPNPPESLPANTITRDVFPAHAYFESAERIFTAAGFNVMRQTEPYRHKHLVLPMPRRFDNQFGRAIPSHARTSPSGTDHQSSGRTASKNFAWAPEKFWPI
jgi:hypothetical protein